MSHPYSICRSDRQRLAMATNAEHAAVKRHKPQQHSKSVVGHGSNCGGVEGYPAGGSMSKKNRPVSIIIGRLRRQHWCVERAVIPAAASRGSWRAA